MADDLIGHCLIVDVNEASKDSRVILCGGDGVRRRVILQNTLPICCYLRGRGQGGDDSLGLLADSCAKNLAT
jgi:hypothetical protein